jgi:hypothetical protein
MPADRSAYAALGLKPGADRTAIERAYKRLIKRHHPDRAGGNADRAAEINRAYRELKRAWDEGDELVEGDGVVFPAVGNGWLWAAFSAGAVIGALIIGAGLAREKLDSRPASGQPAVGLAQDVMDRPLAIVTIDQAMRDAVRIARSQDQMALVGTSRLCHRQLRLSPSLERLDGCAAFDDAVLELRNRDPLRDQGPFSEIEVTERQMSAATILSDDSLAIEGRLDRIRLHVELALAPTVPN